MNRSYNTVFNHRLRVWQVVSEQTRSKGRASKGIILTAGLFLASSAWGQSVTVDGVNQGTSWSTANLSLGFGANPHDVDVDGAGARWTASGNVAVGNVGNGSLDVSNGGSVVLNGANNVIGNNGSTGTVSVDGAGSTLSIASRFEVGASGNGTLNITNGGSVTAGNDWFIVGAQTGIGIINVTGTGSSLIAGSHGITIGDAAPGNGTLNISDGGSVNTAYVEMGSSGATGTLHLDGTAAARGVLQTGYIAKRNGTATIDFDGGVLRAAGNQSDFLQGFSSTDVTISGGGVYIDTNGYSIGIGTDLSGAGSLTKQGSGTLTLSGNNTYTGGTQIDVGTLALGSVGALGTTGTIGFGGGTLQYSAANTTDYSARFSSAANQQYRIDTNGQNVAFSTPLTSAGGSLTKLGSGTLTLAGGNGWSGNTTVSAGTLVLDSYTQTSGQTLTIGAASSADHGSLNVTGTATFNAGANLAIDVASINTLANGNTLTSIINAGTLNATTFTVTDNSALFDFNAVVNGNSVGLNVVAAGSGTGAGSTGTTIYRSVLDNRLFPVLGAAQILDTQIQGTPSGDMANVVNAFGQLPDERSVARAAAQTLPQNSGAAAMMGTLSTVNRLFSNRFAPAATSVSTGEGGGNRQVWIKPFDSRANQGDKDGASGFAADTWGLAAGVERDVGDVRLGLAYAYANTRVNGNTALSGTGNSAKIDSNVLALYGSYPLHGLTLGFQADAGYNDARSVRNLSFGGLDRMANGSYGAWSAHAGTSLSGAIALDAANTLIPAIRLDYTHLKSRAYSETGADALNLNVDAKTTEALVLGADGRIVHRLSERSQIQANLGAGYDFINDRGNIVAAYAGTPGQSFTASGIGHSPWTFQGGVGYTYKTDVGADISVRYDAEGRSGYLNQSASVKASWSF